MAKFETQMQRSHYLSKNDFMKNVFVYPEMARFLNCLRPENQESDHSYSLFHAWKKKRCLHKIVWKLFESLKNNV